MNVNFAIFLILFLPLISCSQAQIKNRPIILIDAGHDQNSSGAIGYNGVSEVVYNDEMAKMIKDEAQNKKLCFDIQLTREKGTLPYEKINELKKNYPEYFRPESLSENEISLSTSLRYRSALADSLDAQLLISIHHDSVSPQFLKTNLVLLNGKLVIAYTATTQFYEKYHSGQTILVSSKLNTNIFPKNNEQLSAEKYSKSLVFAKLVGEKMLHNSPSEKEKRLPSNYHLDDYLYQGRTYSDIDKSLGIIDGQEEIGILISSKTPALIIELGLMTDPKDLEFVRSNAFRKEFIKNLLTSIQEYLRTDEKCLPSL